MDYFWVGLGGCIGAMARYWVYQIEKSALPHAFPMGTLIINIVGCLAAGVLTATAERLLPGYRNLVLFLSMGVIGSFTTFSTFSVESFQLIRANQISFAVTSIGANLCFGLAAVFLGRWIALKF